MGALGSEEERLNMLRRMIQQQMKNAQRGFQVRDSNYGFKNGTFYTEDGKKKRIQNPDSFE